MNISAHDITNQSFTWNGPAGNGGWGLGWSSQKLVTSAIVTATGGTYEVKSPAGKPKTVTRKSKKVK
jgi:hypothetical protein